MIIKYSDSMNDTEKHASAVIQIEQILDLLNKEEVQLWEPIQFNLHQRYEDGILGKYGSSYTIVYDRPNSDEDMLFDGSIAINLERRDKD